MSPSDPNPPSSGFRLNRNAGTILPPPNVPGVTKNVAQGSVDLAGAYQTARSLASTSATETPGGHRIFWVRGDSFAGAHLEASEYAVVGRHTHADIVLSRDAAVALRHLLLRSVTLEDGSAGLHVLDLQTTIGMELADRSRPRAFFARGPVVLRVGEYALVALPNGAPTPEAMPEADVDEATAIPLSPYRVAPKKSETDIGPSSRITVLPPISVIGERRVAPAPTYGDRKLTLERDSLKATVELSESELDAGVLIGRAEKCFDMGLRAVLTDDTNISRVHALLLRERDAVFAFDLGSTQGTYFGSPPRRIRRFALTNAGATLVLGHHRKSRVELYWHPLH